MSDQIEQEIRRAEQAKDLISHPMLAAAFADIDAALITAFRESAPDEDGKRDDAYRMLKALGALKMALHQHIETGQLARARLEELQRADAIRAINRGA